MMPNYNVVTFQYNGQHMQTVVPKVTASGEVVSEPIRKPTLVMLDMDGVVNVEPKKLPVADLAGLIEKGYCYDHVGNIITDPATLLRDIEFTVLQADVFKQLGSIFQKLNLVPFFASQRIAMVKKTDMDGNDYFDLAKAAVVNLEKLPSFEKFNDVAIDNVRREVLRLINQRFQEAGGIQAYLGVAEVIHNHTRSLDIKSLEYQYIRQTIHCYHLIQEIQVNDGSWDSNYGSYQSVISAIRELVSLKKQLCGTAATISDPDFKACLANAPKTISIADPNLPAFLKEFCQTALDIVKTQPTFLQENTAEQGILVKLDDTVRAVMDFATVVVGEHSATQVAYIGFFFPSRTGGCFCDVLKEMYFDYLSLENVGEDQLNEREQQYFKALWQAYVVHIQTSYNISTDTYAEGYEALLSLITIVRDDQQYIDIEEDRKGAIEGYFTIERMQILHKNLFMNFISALTNGNKDIIRQAIKNVSGIEFDVAVLVDDNEFYKRIFQGLFIHADVKAIYNAIASPTLDSLISPEMMTWLVQLCISVESPLTVLALLATNRVADNVMLNAYDRKIAVNLVNHPLFDRAIAATLLQSTGIEAFKETILNQLIEQAKQLPTPADPVHCNRFAVQFMEWLTADNHLNHLPPVIHAMLNQAHAVMLSPKIDPVFLVASLLKAICSQMKSFDSTISPECEAALKAVAESFALMGLDEFNVLRAYKAYDENRFAHISTMIPQDSWHTRIFAGYMQRPNSRGDQAWRKPQTTALSQVLEPSAQPFVFKKSQETHYLPVTEDLAKYDQLLLIGSGDEVELVDFHEALTGDADSQGFKPIHAVINADGLLVVRSRAGLSSDIAAEITARPIALVKKTVIGHRDAQVTASSRNAVTFEFKEESEGAVTLGFMYAQKNALTIPQLVLGIGHESMLDPNYEGPIADIQRVIKAKANGLSIDVLSKAYYYRLAVIVCDYLRSQENIARSTEITFENFLHALKMLAYLTKKSHAVTSTAFKSIEQTLECVANPSQYSLDVTRMEGKLLIWKLFAAASAIGVLIAENYSDNVTSIGFEFLYGTLVESLLNKYVFPTLRVGVGLGYSWFATFWVLAGLKVWDLVKYSKASSEQREVDSLLNRLPGRTRFQQAIVYLNLVGKDGQHNFARLGLSQHDMCQLQAIYSAIETHQISLRDVEFMQHLIDPTILNMKSQKQLMTLGERRAITAMTYLKVGLVFTPAIGSYFMKQGFDTFNSPDVQNIADVVIQGLVKLGVSLGGPQGLYLMLPIITLVLLLPEDSLWRLWQGLSWCLSSCYECLPDSTQQAGRNIMNSISVGGSLSHFGRSRHGSVDVQLQRHRADNMLLQPLLETHDDGAVDSLSIRSQ